MEFMLKAITLLFGLVLGVSVYAVAEHKSVHLPEPSASAKNPSKQKDKQGTVSLAKSAWDGSNVSLGINTTTGNSNTSNYNTQVVLTYTKNKWLTNFTGSYQRGHASEVLNKDVYSLNGQAQYQLGNQKVMRNYLYFKTSLDADKFSPVRYQCLNTVGYGRDWVKSELLTFSTQFGPGYRKNKDDVGVIHKSPIAYFSTTLIWKVTQSGTLTQTFQDSYGRQYNNWSSDTALTNKLIGNLALQVEYTMKYFSKIPAISTNTKKMDTSLNVNLLYSF